MTLRENLIPDDQPYGERKAAREAMREAGVPTETGVMPAGPAVASVGGALPAGSGDAMLDGDLFEGAVPQRNLLDRPMVASDPLEGLRQIRDTATNPFMAMVLTRFLGDR